MDPGAAAAGYPQSAVVGLASLSGAHVVGPLLLSNAFTWALWGTLTVQLYIFVLAQSKFGSARAKPRNAQTHRKGLVLPLPFVRETRRGAETGPGAGVEAKSSGAEGSGGRRRFRAGSELFADADVNPWTLSVSFAAPNSPSTYEVDTQKQHARQQSSRSGLSSSEPYVAEHVDAGYPGADGIRQFSVRPADATPSSSLSQLLARGGAGEPRDDDFQWGSGNDWAKARPPPPSFFVRTTAYTLYALVCVHTALNTVQFWRVAVGGWNTILPASNLGPGGPGLGVHRWVGTVVADCVCPVVFLISMLYFMHALFLSPCACPPSAPADASTKHRSLSGFANKNSKSRTSLRPLSLLKPRTPSVDYAAHPYPLFPRTEDCFSPRTPTANGTSADGGHVQPVPSRASRFVRRVRRAFTGSGKETAIGFGRFVQPALLFVTAAVVAACGLVDSGRTAKNAPLIGAPPVFDGIAVIWLAGMLCLDAIVFLLLCLSLVTSRRLGGLTWLGRAMHVFGEGGGAQLLVAALALAFVVIWKGGNSLSTIPRVPIALFPAVYANTVLLNATRSYVGISLFASSSSHQQAGSSAATPSSYTPPAKYEHKEDIEMGLRGVSRSNEGVARRIDLTTAGTSSGTGTGSYGTTTADSTDAGAALRAHAMAVGAQREREEAAQKAAEAGPTAQALMHMERDTLGESSAARAQGSNTGLSSTRPSAGQVTALTQRSGEAAPSVRSHMSGISQGALSLELPVFRKGRGYDINGLYMGDDDDTSSYISSDDGDGGTWDYGYAVNIANLERERAATLLATSKHEADKAQAKVAPGLRWQVQNHMKRSSYPVLSRSRPTSKRRSAFSPQDSSAALGDGEDDEDDDKLSVLSTASRRTRSRHSHSHLPMPVRRLLPRVPTIPDDASVADSGEGSIMVIGRRPEPSIAEASVFRAASVAATRASTGSAFSSFTYPKPMAFPDLDEDLSLSGSADPTAASARFYYDPDSAGSSALGAVVDQNLGDRVSSVTGGGTGDSAPHPYAAAADEADERRQREEESAKRRWRVHPLKRMVEVGRLRR